MKTFGSLHEFAEFISHDLAGHAIHEAKTVALEEVCKMIVAEAKRVLGTYDFEWPQLAAATQAERASQGYPENAPLLRTGELRDSISYEILAPGEEAMVGSTSDKAVWHEFGTAMIPPRPFLMPSLIYLEPAIKRMVGEIVGSAVAGSKLQAEFIKLAIEVLKSLGETAKELAPEEEPKRARRR